MKEDSKAELEEQETKREEITDVGVLIDNSEKRKRNWQDSGKKTKQTNIII